ncbi:MAG: Xaa-Pro peptidase family protein [Rikenellaceae bacterium]
MYNENIAGELRLRWNKILNLMKEQSVEALLVATTSNLFYTSSKVFSGYTYFSTSKQEPTFFVKRPVGLEGENVVYIRKVEDIANFISPSENVALELDTLPYGEVTRYAKVFGEAKLINGSHILRVSRSVKTDYELNLIRLSGEKHTASYAEFKSLYRPNITDIEFSIEAERIMRKNGSLGLFRIAGSSMEIFFGSVIVGENADNPSPYDFAMGGEGQNSSLPVGANGTTLKEGQTMMVDLGGNFTGYMTDMTRTYCLGEVSELARKAHQVSCDIAAKFEVMAQEGVAACDMFNMAQQTAEEAGLSQYFMGHKQKAGFVGHGVGIEINELPVLAPRSRDLLKKGMVVALEPKFVIPEVGAVGIENTYIITETGVEKVTNAPEALEIF